MKRKEIYKYLSNILSSKYHTAKIRSVKEGEVVYKLVLELKEKEFLINKQ
jgi:hypothetical protein